jgi:murein DD-endopeptidase MepM/ murein hydrolase activator NlpD
MVFAAACGFMAGMLVMAGLVLIFPAGPLSSAERPVEAAAGSAESADAAPARSVDVRPSPKEMPPAVTPPSAAPIAPVPAIAADPIAELRRRQLSLPVSGAMREHLTDTFAEGRGTSRRHEAMDVLAPRNTPVIAVEDGTIAKLFLSDAGGITVYQFDPTAAFVYYYAHLERYADGLKEGDAVKRSQVLGFVGTSGNAPKDTPHLHFAIFKLTDDKRWWEGSPIDPYTVLR